MKGTVLIYEFSLDDFRGLDLSPEKLKHLWKDVVEYFRNGSKGGISKVLKKKLRKVDYIIGPISTRAYNTQDKECKARIIDGTTQLCIKSTKMANSVTSKLFSVIHVSGP